MQPDQDGFPRLKARTGGFRRGQPRSLEAFADGDRWHVRYLCSGGPFDPVLSLRQLDSTGRTRVLADPAGLLADGAQLPEAERARRERMRESGAGITAFSSDRAGSRSVFTLGGALYLVDDEGRPEALPVAGAVDPRLSPDGARVACHADGGVTLVDIASGGARVLCAPEHPDHMWGLAEFIAGEEMGRQHGLWWSPDSDRLLVAEVDNTPVGRWWIGDPAQPAAPPRAVRYPAAGTANAEVALWLMDLTGRSTAVEWDRGRYPYLAAVRWQEAGALMSVQSRDQRTVLHLRIEADGSTREAARQQAEPWVELVPGTPRLTPEGEPVLVDVDEQRVARRLRIGERWASPPQVYVRSVLACDEAGIWFAGSRDPRENHLFRLSGGELRQLTGGPAWHGALAGGPLPVTAVQGAGQWQPRFVVGDPGDPVAVVPNLAGQPPGRARTRFLEPERGGVRVAVVLPEDERPRPVIVSSYGGPHAQRVVFSPLSLATEEWFADQGFAVVVIDGRGTPGVSPGVEFAVAGDLATGVLEDQVAGLHAAARAFPDRLDLSRVGIRGWSFGGYLAALAVLAEPAVFHAAFAGAPVTDWRLYDTHYTERYLGDPVRQRAAYERSSLIRLAPGLRRPLCLVHGMADDNVVAAHTLQLSAALTAHGREHQVLPLPGVSHMTPQESLTENLLRLELLFFQRHLRS